MNLEFPVLLVVEIFQFIKDFIVFLSPSPLILASLLFQGLKVDNLQVDHCHKSKELPSLLQFIFFFRKILYYYKKLS